MPWFRVDDQLYSHPKWLAVPSASRALWVTAGSWCAAQLTDGLVPRHVLPMLGGKPKDAQALVDAGLWLTEDGGWRFHDWHDRQPTAEKVKAERTAAAERQQRARDRARESRRDDPDRHGPPDPTRPDQENSPTSPVTQEGPDPAEPVWRLYAHAAAARRNDITSLAPWIAATAKTAKAQHHADVTRWLTTFDITPAQAAAALVDPAAKQGWMRRTEAS